MNKIDSMKYYTANEIYNLQLFPSWIQSLQSIVRWIERDKQGENILQATIYGEGSGKRYRILGSNLIKFIAKLESGDYSQVS